MQQDDPQLVDALEALRRLAQSEAIKDDPDVHRIDALDKQIRAQENAIWAMRVTADVMAKCDPV